MSAPFDVDAIIDRLLEVRGSKPGRAVQLSEAEIRELCYRSREIFISQPILLELEAPIKICGKAIISTRSFVSVFSKLNETRVNLVIYAFGKHRKTLYDFFYPILIL